MHPCENNTPQVYAMFNLMARISMSFDCGPQMYTADIFQDFNRCQESISLYLNRVYVKKETHTFSPEDAAIFQLFLQFFTNLKNSTACAAHPMLGAPNPSPIINLEKCSDVLHGFDERLSPMMQDKQGTDAQASLKTLKRKKEELEGENKKLCLGLRVPETSLLPPRVIEDLPPDLIKYICKFLSWGAISLRSVSKAYQQLSDQDPHLGRIQIGCRAVKSLEKTKDIRSLIGLVQEIPFDSRSIEATQLFRVFLAATKRPHVKESIISLMHFIREIGKLYVRFSMLWSSLRNPFLQSLVEFNSNAALAYAQWLTSQITASISNEYFDSFYQSLLIELYRHRPQEVQVLLKELLEHVLQIQITLPDMEKNERQAYLHKELQHILLEISKCKLSPSQSNQNDKRIDGLLKLNLLLESTDPSLLVYGIAQLKFKEMTAESLTCIEGCLLECLESFTCHTSEIANMNFLEIFRRAALQGDEARGWLLDPAYDGEQSLSVLAKHQLETAFMIAFSLPRNERIFAAVALVEHACNELPRDPLLVLDLLSHAHSDEVDFELIKDVLSNLLYSMQKKLTANTIQFAQIVPFIERLSGILHAEAAKEDADGLIYLPQAEYFIIISQLFDLLAQFDLESAKPFSARIIETFNAIELAGQQTGDLEEATKKCIQSFLKMGHNEIWRVIDLLLKEKPHLVPFAINEFAKIDLYAALQLAHDKILDIEHKIEVFKCIVPRLNIVESVKDRDVIWAIVETLKLEENHLKEKRLKVDAILLDIVKQLAYICDDNNVPYSTLEKMALQIQDPQLRAQALLSIYPKNAAIGDANSIDKPCFATYRSYMSVPGDLTQSNLNMFKLFWMTDPRKAKEYLDKIIEGRNMAPFGMPGIISILSFFIDAHCNHQIVIHDFLKKIEISASNLREEHPLRAQILLWLAQQGCDTSLL